MPEITPQLLTTREAAKEAGLTIKQVARMVTRGELTPAAKAPGVRGAYLFDPNTITALADKKAS